MTPHTPVRHTASRPRPFALNTLALLATLSLAAQATAQTNAVTLDLASAVTRAIANGPDVNTSRANLQKAQANSKAVQADPTSIITDQLAAQQTLQSATVGIANTKLSVMQTVISQYLGIYEADQRTSLNAAQVNFYSRSLQIAQARLAAKVATQLDVTKAQNSLSSNQQELADAKAQRPIAAAQLAKTLGLGQTAVTVKDPAAPPALSSTLASLQAGLDDRLPALVQAANAVQTAQLQVKVSDNDYTPARTLQDAQTALSNAQRDLDSGRKVALTALNDAYRAAQNAREQVGISAASLAAQQTSLNQAQARLKAGTAAAIDVQNAQVLLLSAQFALAQAQDNSWKALAALSVAAGKDVTGLVQ
ncbi:TolC family protein [Deinococcus psychrotolerans]|uniref:TolC family protein n=1 Tax=Deinococcus psychrotolerans TaxID=2489213 RepID=A0A3G8Y7J5_9DEIO|nr:TolC family protein [Deinococcus psychrotolerans]AZI41352.1 TolC family protein [Deinococcus psychrotolerans]